MSGFIILSKLLARLFFIPVWVAYELHTINLANAIIEAIIQG
jgi:hypothetical protein